MRVLQKQFLERYNSEGTLEVALSRAIAAAVQHNSLYRTELPIQQKKQIQSEWQAFLRAMIPRYQSLRSILEYECDVQRLKDLMNQQFAAKFYEEPHPKYLTDPGFRISHAQKSVAVFLKHIWCMGQIQTPPQCPIDSIILAKAGRRYPETKWGYVNSLEEHRTKVGFLVSAKADDTLPLAHWELRFFAIAARL